MEPTKGSESMSKHPAVALEQITEDIQRIDNERLQLLESRQDLERKARELMPDFQKITERAHFTVDGPVKEDNDAEHFESVRARRRGDDYSDGPL